MSGTAVIVQLAQQYPNLRSLRLVEWTERDLILDNFSSLRSLLELSIVESRARSISLFVPLPTITLLNLSRNAFEEFEQFCNLTRNLPALGVLLLNENHINILPTCIKNVAVRTLSFRKNYIASINGSFNEETHNIDLSRNLLRSASGLHENLLRLSELLIFVLFDLSYNPLKDAVFPSFALLQQLDLSGTRFNTAPPLSAPKLIEFRMDQSTVVVIDFSQLTIPSIRSGRLTNCTLGISQRDPETVRAEFGETAVISCTAYGTPQPEIEWWLYRPATYLGTFDPASSVQVQANNSCCTVLNGGALLLHDVNRSMVERYVCLARHESQSVNRIFHFRLDYLNWYSLDLFNSVFWGAVATAVLVCSFSFLLNITWILTRKSVLWWIQRAERLSRVRKMVEAMEKYRVRQMEGLHEKYTRRMQLVRENYHAQVEALRLSYSSQVERFRDYRAAQMEQMSSHLENIRDNYNQQMQRVREYGSRRAEQLWESYERQVNRMKAFSLQHRLKMMRQYKVKQRYLNKLLESFQDSTASPDALRKHEEEVRAALELPDPPPPESPTEEHPLSRSSSFYSLPEYIIDDDGVVRPSPILGKVRFTPSKSVIDKDSLNKAPNDTAAGVAPVDSEKHKESDDRNS
ncbi:leucine Rich repeat-containing domain protein [Oesophagostomum dentatum]|uniref:Leucine Rich repeat-containing domain protein n=1 Tax=Oesophagostomum dentatum TaxID=61180 RepID=A0A0B1TU04_OESDE|nr:leucine Rich repeat-containing domain protein [Oesophagostomum dentatum]